MFFILSAGRSGSQTLAFVLSQSPSCLCLHEPHPQLVGESARYCYGRMEGAAVASLLRATRSPTLAGRRYGEANNRLALVIPPLLEAFPSVQIVWLLRDGRDYVASELQRGAYQNSSQPWWATSKWDRFRIRGDKAGAVSAAKWAQWDPFAKICWQWDWVNRRIAEGLAQIEADHTRRLRIEDVRRDLAGLAGWLDITPVEFVVPQANRRRAQDDPGGAHSSPANNVGRIGYWPQWTDPMRCTFEELCGDTMDNHYPGWRDQRGDWVDLRARGDESPLADSEASPERRLALARARAVELEILLHEERSAYNSLIGNIPKLTKHLLQATYRRATNRPAPTRGSVTIEQGDPLARRSSV